ncbi:protein translocase subunit SecF [Silanimonas sp.]|uniref:protein translocase subunit SecF n=1 Tax=Silanimonas sp. TaxID=1929290 RepID=UPI001BB91C89|nr:protein translocase subunit SecF [Silanimonas sp.]MBS3895658.1 protein translocase subunit SecF [Silanimonas sp.]MBS3958073.1 protein translocase subunit SecF [Xanthomonadaceae bacterium]
MLYLIPYNTRYDLIRLKTLSLIIAVGLIVAGIALMAVRGFNFALDFTGGTVAELQFEQAPDLEVVRARLEAGGYTNAVVQTFGSANDVVVRLQPKALAEGETAAAAAAAATGGAIADLLSEPGNRVYVVRSDFVGPQVGQELATNGVLALAFVVFGFLIYITIRFEWKFAVAAIVTTMHDVVLVLAFFALTQREFDLTVLAGVLSVLGYSINDTIVIFDRVRENFRALHKIEPTEVLNRSVNQTLSRTIITSLIAFLTVLALYIYGGSSLEGMAAAQMVGIVVGTLSSIFIACPLLLWLKVSKQDLLPKIRDEAELERRP